MSDSDELCYQVAPGGCLHGTLPLPGDKSISHRAIMLGALAEGITTITGFLEGEDSLATLRAFRAMGVDIVGPDQGKVTVHGVGLHGLKAPLAPLDLGNSGTSMRLLAGLMSGQGFDCRLTGDTSLARRPMQRVAAPLNTMGAKVVSRADGTPPLDIQGGQRLSAINYEMPVASAQVKSSLLLAGLYAEGETRVRESAVTRDHTERMLAAFSWPVQRRGDWVSIKGAGGKGGGCLQARDIEVPGDISSAAFFMVGASIAKGSDLILQGVGINPTRTGIIDILRLMGANIELDKQRTAGAEPVADIRIRAAELHGIDIPESLVPLAIDEFPVIFIAAACARGVTRLSGAKELRVKESDRIQVMADGLQVLSVDAQATPDGMHIRGGSIQGGVIDSHGDHRIAMAFAMAGLRAQALITIHDCQNVSTSFPGFPALSQGHGLQIRVM